MSSCGTTPKVGDMTKKVQTDEEKPLPSNRDKVRRPRKGRFWCRHCDGALIGAGNRCPRCKLKDYSKAFRK